MSGTRLRNILTVYSSEEGVQCHRVRMVLAAKGVNYDRILVPPTGKAPAEMLQVNPYGSLPTMIDHDLVLYDAGVICEYIDERYPHPPLMPIDPLSRARLRLAIVRIEQEWLPLMDTIVGGGRSVEKARQHFTAALVAAVPLFEAATFFLSPDVSLADCMVAPIVWRLPALGLDLPAQVQPIFDYGERIFRSEGFARSLTPQERALRE